MEMASFLAGERWSDRPACTDPVLAELARWVNDMLDHPHRQRLVMMVPEVVGLTPDDPRATTGLLLTAARAALPVAAPERQCIMALAILNAERVLADREGRSPDHLSEPSRSALTSSPGAESWARAQLARRGFSPAAVRPSSAAKVVSLAVDGIARAWIDDRQERLVDLLRDGIDVMAAFSPLVPDPLVVSWPVREPGVRQTAATRKARSHPG
ncbi:hypothetical protein [Terrabacter sp. BE26]|uniref:hypothetical protein n=1 Tax=Terrabacter sp. BE26 TaxID=2898152 RepID=UPI0035BE7CCC